MDTVHDLGGKEGYGPVPIEKLDAPFDHDWERRMWAMARMGIATDITIDWFRHCLERMVPVDYLGFSYFQKWCTNYLMMMVDNGQFTMDEVLAGKVTSPAPDHPKAKSLDELREHNRAMCTNFEAPVAAEPRFAPGDTVSTLKHGVAGHTRLPAYARGATGTVIAHHGGHILPDVCARGEHVGEHLYTVSFSAPELWGPDAHPKDSVSLELWESYLV